MSFICLSLVACCLYAFSVTWENKKRSRQPDQGGLTEEEKADLGVSRLLIRLLLCWISGLLTVTIGSQSRVQVYALSSKM